MRTVQCCRGGNGNPLGSQLSALGLIGARTQPAPVVNSIHWRFWPLWYLWPQGLHLHVFPLSFANLFIFVDAPNAETPLFNSTLAEMGATDLSVQICSEKMSRSH